MCEILDYVDFDRIAQASPKWYMGYSDNTNLTFLLPTLCDTAAIYGPCAGTFGMEPWHASVQDALDLLRGKKLTMHSYDRWEKEGFKTEENPLVPYQYHGAGDNKALWHTAAENESVSGELREEIRFQGRLLGGCTGLSGQSDRDEVRPCPGVFGKVCRGWNHLVSGVLRPERVFHPPCHVADEACGLVFPCEGLPDRPASVLRTGDDGPGSVPPVWEPLKEYRVPVIMDVDLGHLPPQMPLICGSMADVTLRRTKEQPDWKLEIDMQLK